MFIAAAPVIVKVESGSGWEKGVAIATLVVAAGTLALAVATVILARYTRRSVEASERSVEASQRSVETAQEDLAIARAQLEGSVRPILGEVPEGTFRATLDIDYAITGQPGQRATLQDEADIHVEALPGAGMVASVPFRNVGAGVAVVENAHFRHTGEATDYQAFTPTRLVPPGERTRSFVTFSVTIENQFWAEVIYTDIGGGQRTRTRLFLRHDARGWRLWGGRLYAGDAEEPFVRWGDTWD